MIRFLRTVRHFPVSALYHRLERRVRRRFYRTPPVPAALQTAWQTNQPVFFIPLFDRLQFNADHPASQERLQDLREGQKGFILNTPFSLPADAQALQALLADQSDLWRENYAYLEFLLPLIYQAGREPETHPDDITLIIRQMTLFWELPEATRNWSVYGVARRLLVYFELQPLLGQTPPGFRQAFVGHYYQDAHYLSRFPETDVQGNHLIRNLKAWLAASLFFAHQPALAPTARRWQAKLLRWLPQSFASQVLTDGFHMERTPMYHAWVLVDLLDCLSLLGWLEDDLPGRAEALETLRALARQMLAALPVVYHCSGQVALFGDSSGPQTPSLFAVQIHASAVLEDSPGTTMTAYPPRPEAFQGLPQAGFCRFNIAQPHASLIVDVGDLAPRRLPAHSHCDMGSFEVHVGNQPIIVDAGITEYRPGPERDYFRGTAAHNTLWVPGEEQAELWGSFRVAEYPEHQGCEMASDEGGAKATISYENHNHRYHHQRSVYSVLNRLWVVQDWVRHLAPAGRECYSLLHVPVDCDIEYAQDAFMLGDCLLVLPFGGRKLEWTGHSPWRHGHLNLLSPGFSQAAPGQVIAMTPRLEDCFGWVLVPYVGGARPAHQRLGESVALTLEAGPTLRMTWDSEGLHVAVQGPNA